MTEQEFHNLIDLDQLAKHIDTIDTSLRVGIQQLIISNSEEDQKFDLALISDYLFCNQIMYNKNGGRKD